jgi:hypothetical protein
VSLEVQFLSGADADFQAIFNKLEDRREGYGVEFALAVDAYLTRLSSFPESAPVYFENVRQGQETTRLRTTDRGKED